MCVKRFRRSWPELGPSVLKHQSDIEEVTLKNSTKNFLSQQPDAQLNPTTSLVSSWVLEQSLGI